MAKDLGRSPTRPATLEDLTGVLSNPYTGLFYGVEDAFKEHLINSLSRDCQVVTYRPRDVLFVQGQDTIHIPIFLVKSGLLGVLNRYEKEDKTLLVSLNRSGDVTGYVEFILRSEPAIPEKLIPFADFYGGGLSPAEQAKSTMLSLTETEVVAIYGDSRDALLSHCQISKNLNRILVLKYLRRSAWAGAIRVYDRAELTALLFQSLAANPEEGGVGIDDNIDHSKLDPKATKGRKYVRLKCQMTQDDLAYAFGVSKQAFAPAFRALNERGWVLFQRGNVYLLKDIAENKITINDKVQIRL